MTRIFLGGKGDHIPDIALPDPHIGDAVPIVLMMADQEIFKVVDYINLGYTYFQAWCVGAAGGFGASVTDKYAWTFGAETLQSIPSGDPSSNYLNYGWCNYVRDMTPGEWNAYVALFTLPSYQILDPAYWDPVTHGYRQAGGGRSGAYYSWLYLTGPQYAEYCNPAHKCFVHTHTDVYMQTDSWGSISGGAGGGGGLHVVTGRLDELPPEVLCTVGQPGADAPKALGRIWTPNFDASTEYVDHFDYSKGAYVDEFPNPRPLLQPPQRGGDGGYSSFGDICMASGGHGGWPAAYFDSELTADFRLVHRFFDARGGAGGKGNSLVSGGGASGAYDPMNPKPTAYDGIWNQNTGIGTGGGGGRGGYEPIPVVSGTTLGSGLPGIPIGH